MVKLKIGDIPSTRLADARRVRDKLKIQIGDKGYVVLSIFKGGYSVVVRIYEGKEFNKAAFPALIEGIPVKVNRVLKNS